MLKSIIKYFKDCYVADQRDLTLWSIFDKKIQHLYLIEKEEELVNGALPNQYIPEEMAKVWQSILQVYRKEKQLYYFSFIVTGNTGLDAGGRKRICAPLVYYPAQIEEQDGYHYLSINFAQRQLNYPLISLLTTSAPEGKDYLEEISNSFPNGPITFGDCGIIEKAMSPYLENLNWEEMYLYPKLNDATTLKNYQRKQQLHVMPAGAVGIVESSRQTRGVLNELTALSTEKQLLSTPLQQLFEKQTYEKLTTTKETKYVPVVLSKAQDQALENAQANRISMVIGPPGTGKSYTIAAMAVDCLSKGQTVLIASKMDHAVDVIGDKIEEQLGHSEMIIRAGRSNYLSDLKRNIQAVLSGNRRKKPGEGLRQQAHHLREELAKLTGSADAITRQFRKRVASEIKWADILYKQEPSWFLERWFKEFKAKRIRAKIASSTKMWELLHSVEAFTDQRNSLISEYLQAVTKFNVWQNVYDYDNRIHLKQFLKGLRARTGSKQENLFAETDFNVVLRTFPIWLVKLADLYNVLPLQKELFDVAIIDEATQCDIATSIPLFQRAKRVVVVGDPQQLRHVSFLSKARERILIRKNGLSETHVDWLDYREKSVLDLVDEQITHQETITFLDEHFRSLPDIIRYSNQTFYGDDLHVMTQNPINLRKKGLELIECEGKRTAKGINVAEADVIFEKLAVILKEEEALAKEVCHNIGILSPFRDQVDYLRDRLSDNISPKLILKHDIQVGTAHSFQGEERDIMFLSFVVDEHSHSGSFIHLNKADVFNVAITRARMMQYVLTSVPVNKLKTTTNLYQYLRDIRHEEHVRQASDAQTAAYDEFLNQVINALEKHEVICYPNYPIAGLEVDLVAECNQQVLGIDLIGWSEELGEAFSLERYQILNRAGLKLIPLPYTWWKTEQQECLEVILDTLLTALEQKK